MIKSQKFSKKNIKVLDLDWKILRKHLQEKSCKILRTNSKKKLKFCSYMFYIKNIWEKNSKIIKKSKFYIGWNIFNKYCPIVFVETF